jgi:hypothetical protein
MVDGKWWIVDATPSGRFPLHCRGNVGEVFPNVVSPLTGSLAIRGAVRGQERWAVEFGTASAEQLSDDRGRHVADRRRHERDGDVHAAAPEPAPA